MRFSRPCSTHRKDRRLQLSRRLFPQSFSSQLQFDSIKPKSRPGGQGRTATNISLLKTSSVFTLYKHPTPESISLTAIYDSDVRVVGICPDTERIPTTSNDIRQIVRYGSELFLWCRCWYRLLSKHYKWHHMKVNEFEKEGVLVNIRKIKETVQSSL